MKIYTRTGDGGETGLLGPVRVPKDHIRIAAYGEVDELNAQLGALRRVVDDPTLASMLEMIQGTLFEVGSELARPPAGGQNLRTLREEDVATLEAAIDQLDAALSPLDQFILPGGSEAACRAHLARCVCRRAERAVVHLLRTEPCETLVIRYLNRLSDFLFVLSRWANREAGVSEQVWRPRSSGANADEAGGPNQVF